MIKIIDKFRKNRLLFILGILIILTLLILIFRISYAFLASSVNSAQGSIVVDSDDTDNLSFSVGNPLSINATPTTLPENGANLTSSTTASATLIANTTNSTAEANYYVYFSISNNTFIYSDGSTPEIILTVTGPDGEITNIDGLTYGTFSGVSGFDVTIQNGTFGVAIPTTITTNSSTTGTTQNWTFTLTYLNLPSDQSANFGNSMTTEVMIQKNEASTNEITLLAENTTIYGENYSLTNLLGSIGSFENGGWSSECSIDSTIKKYGTNSCRMDGISGSPEKTLSTAATFPLDPTHMYYARTEALVTDATIVNSVSAGIYWPVAEPNFVEGVKVTANEWTIISKVTNRSTFAASNYNFRLDFNNNNVAGTMYFDGSMLIDLTATYGNSYPDKTYLDGHLMYFDDTASMKSINVLENGTFNVNNVNNYTNIICSNGATATINDKGIITVINNGKDTVCKLGK